MSRKTQVAVMACALSVGSLSCTRLLNALYYGAGPEELGRGLRDAASELHVSSEQQARCNGLGKVEIPQREEVAFGGAVAVKLAQQGKGLFIRADGNVEALRDPRAVKLRSVPENELNRYLNQVGKNLAAQSARPGLDWTFGVIDSDSTNAFSAPGGYVLVTRGLLRRIDNEAELAGVLAHEIGHVTQAHALKVYRTLKVAECYSALGGELLRDVTGRALQEARAVGQSLQSTVAPGNPQGFLDLDSRDNFGALKLLVDKAVDAIVSHGFAHDDELDADRVGLELAINAGYRPDEYIAFLAKLPDSKDAFPNHPPKQERQEKLRAWLQKVPERGELLVASDYPFTSYATVPLKDELAAARP